MSFKLFIPSFLHLLVDFFSIFLLFSFKVDTQTALLLVVLYDCLAFMSQPIFGALIEKVKRLNGIISLSVMVIIVAQFITLSYIAIPLAALGNALFHVAAGKLVIDKSSKSSPLGIFISFGALGVGFATLYANKQLFVLLLFILFVLVLVNEFINYDDIPYVNNQENNDQKTYIFPVILIMIGVTLRGFFGYYTDKSSLTQLNNGALISVFVVFIAKFIGGFLIDKFKMIPVIILSLILSIIGISFAQISYLYLFGVFGVNLLMAATLELIRRVLPNNHAFGFGLLASCLAFGSLLGIYLIGSYKYIFYINMILTSINSLSLILSVVYYKKKKGVLL